ncbi:unnamed protein product [Cylindrotheca closterium]|uniref:Uncharacterized protein n=1 Tax=Cylindrotheca closterium TaxID=2856 RepID=A0AAD2CTE5_9STRA|nr:unnamed protein product [Cylindrotheca closterium]
MNTKLFWENVNKRMKYERAQRLQRRRKAGVKRSVKINQMDEEKQLQIECLLQVLEEYVTASLSHPEEPYRNEQLSEDIDIIYIAVQKLKKDMADDVLLAAGISSEAEDNANENESPGLTLALKVLDDLANDTITNKENDKHGFATSLHANEEEFEEGKENLTKNLVETESSEVVNKDSSVSGPEILSTKNMSSGDNGNESEVLASTKDVSQNIHRSSDESNAPSSQQLSSKPSKECDITTDAVADATDTEDNTRPGAVQVDQVGSKGEALKIGDGRNDNHDAEEVGTKSAGVVEGIAEESQHDDATVDDAVELNDAGIFSDPINVATNANLVESQSAADKSNRKSVDTTEPRQNKDTLRFLKKPKFAINRKKSDKPSMWSRTMDSRSEQQDFSQFEEDMRKEKPKFNVKGDKLLLKAIASLKKNLSQERAEEGPNPEPLPPRLLDAVNNLDSSAENASQ